MNKALIVGNITKELELKKTPSNKSVLDFDIAVNKTIADKQTTEYISVRAWEKTAENIAQYCRKGYKILVEGEIKTDSWEKDGHKNYKTYVLANNVEFIQPRTQTVYEQTTLTGNGRGVDGFPVNDNKLIIEEDDLPFY